MKPDRIMRHRPYPGAKTYIIHLYASKNVAIIYDPDFEEPMMEYGPINDKARLEINVIMRKAARYLRQLEIDKNALKEEGFRFIAAPAFPEKAAAGSKKAAKAEKEAARMPGNAPKWTIG